MMGLENMRSAVVYLTVVPKTANNEIRQYLVLVISFNGRCITTVLSSGAFMKFIVYTTASASFSRMKRHWRTCTFRNIEAEFL